MPKTVETTLRVDLDRPLPHNPDAERSILGAILLDNRALTVACAHVRAEDFFLLEHRRIFCAMIALDVNGAPIDTTMLMEHLQTAGELEAAGGAAYLSTLPDGIPRISNVEHYARIVKGKSQLRQLIHGSNAVANAAFDGDAEIALARLDSLASANVRQQPNGAVKIVSGKELLHMHVEPREFIVEGLLTRRSMTEIFSWRGVGKTWLALALGCAVSSGTKFLKWDVTKPRPVLFVDGELDAASLQQRIRALGGDTDNLRLLCSDMQDDPFPSLATIKAQNIIESALGDAQLLILDNLSALAPSSNDTEAEDWISIQTWLLDLRRRGIAPIFLHHAGHAGWSRGTTRREDLLDLVIELRRPKDYVANEGLRLEMHFTKTRGLLGAGVEPIEARLETDLDGKLSWTIRTLEDLRERQIRDLQAAGSSIRDIAEATGIPRTTVGRILNNGARGV